MINKMNIRAAIICLLLLFAAPLGARERTDVVIMKNGDHITSEIKGLDSGVLYVSLDYVDGTVSVQWSKVARLESSQLFIVKTEDGSVYTGTLHTTETPAGRPVTIQIVETRAEEKTVERSQIVKVAQTSDKFWQRFNGGINFGTIYSKGNESTQFNLGSQVTYPRERWSAGATFNSTLSSSTGATPSTRNSLSLSSLRLLRWNNWFYAGLGNLLQSSEQGIRRQVNLGAGVGRVLKNTNHANISLMGGVAWQNTNYRQSTLPQTTQNVAATVVAAEVKLFRFKKTNLDITAFVFPAVSTPGRVFFNTNATYFVKLFSNLNWNVSFYGNWDNQPPGRLSGSDYGSSSGLGWTFGNK